METKQIRIRLPVDLFLKYKVFCAMNDKTMIEQTEHILREYIKKQNEHIKIINLSKDEGK